MRRAEFCARSASVIALGTMDFGGKIPEGQATDFMDAYLEIGGNLIDTARIYGDFAHEIQGGSEEVIGRWLTARGNRDQIILSTKGAHPDIHAMHRGRLRREDILSDMQKSLDALKTDHVDIYYLHRDDPDRPVEDILETLTELKERGMTRFVGVSNWRIARIMEAARAANAHHLVEIAANQPQFSLARQVVVEDDTLCQMDRETYAYHVTAKLPCMPFSAQAKGFLSKMDAQGEAALNDKARRRYFCPENLNVLERAQRVARETGLSMNSVALGWLTAQPFPTFPIAGVSRMAHIDALREAGEAYLTGEQRDFIRTL